MRTEAEHGVFVVEGPRSLRTLLSSPYPVVSVLLRPERVAGLADVVVSARHRGVPVYVAGRQVFEASPGFRCTGASWPWPGACPIRSPWLCSQMRRRPWSWKG
jgi:hypothetical protein